MIRSLTLAWASGLMQNTESQGCWQCATQRVCWEDLGRLSTQPLRAITGAALMQLGLCQHLLKDYTNARLMIEKARPAPQLDFNAPFSRKQSSSAVSNLCLIIQMTQWV